MILAIDQGTSGTTCIVFGEDGRERGRGYSEFRQHFPRPGWVEHDAAEIWEVTRKVAIAALADAGVQGSDLAGIGITNQRETVVAWDPDTGEPVHNALVWQDRRTADRCDELREQGHEDLIRERTGLVIDPYFSGTKIEWLIKHGDVPPDAAFGTIDSWLVHKLTGAHVTDFSNASRTLLFDIRRGEWDDELLRLLGVPRALLPDVRDSSGEFGEADASLLGAAIPVAGIAGDQHAALVGQTCFEPGMAKSTYGTGCFLLLNTGTEPIESQNRLLTTPAYRIGGCTTYAMEGSIFVAGAAIKWLRDGLGVIRDAAETEALARQVPDSHGVHLVPAFVGLGAPHWRPDVRGLLTGLTLDVKGAHLARAALESVAFQTQDLVAAMAADGTPRAASIRVDGGMSANGWFCQFLADLLDARVERPAEVETTALGAAFLAGLATGVWPNLQAVAATWASAASFEPAMAPERRQALLAGWKAALGRALAT